VLKRRLTGFCTAGCGACCQHVYLPKPLPWSIFNFFENGVKMLAIGLPHSLNEDARAFYRARGLRISPFGKWAYWPGSPAYTEAMNAGHPALRFDVPCPHLTDERMCDLHGDARKPLVCVEYPTVHTDLSSVTPPCTFKVEEVDDGVRP
jgi:hypothetical protein